MTVINHTPHPDTHAENTPARGVELSIEGDDLIARFSGFHTLQLEEQESGCWCVCGGC